MNRKHKAMLKLNIVSLFLIALSSISVTLAWFAYSGIAKVSTEIDVKSWLIEFEKNSKTTSNEIVISTNDIYPGMETIYESIKVKNKGDSNAKLSYSIISARIFDEKLEIENVEQDYLKDKLSHNYPFSINIDLSDNFVIAKNGEAEFKLSISWPLDSVNKNDVNTPSDEIVNETDSDKIDSEWGNLAYQFESEEIEKYNADPTYKIRPAIKIIISAKAEQMLESEESSDINYPLGKLVLYDVKNNVKCEELGNGCIRTHVIDIDNKIGDSNATVSLLPDLLETYESGTYDNYDNLLKTTITNWNVETRKLQIDDILKIISKDISNSLIKREEVSDAILGYMNYGNRINNIISKTVPYNGYYTFLNTEYSYLATNKCYWLNKEYKDTKVFALTKIDDEISKVYGEEKNKECSVVPVIIVPKKNIKDQ